MNSPIVRLMNAQWRCNSSLWLVTGTLTSQSWSHLRVIASGKRHQASGHTTCTWNHLHITHGKRATDPTEAPTRCCYWYGENQLTSEQPSLALARPTVTLHHLLLLAVCIEVVRTVVNTQLFPWIQGAQPHRTSMRKNTIPHAKLRRNRCALHADTVSGENIQCLEQRARKFLACIQICRYAHVHTNTYTDERCPILLNSNTARTQNKEAYFAMTLCVHVVNGSILDLKHMSTQNWEPLDCSYQAQCHV